MSNLIGGRLGGWRRAKGLSQAALAARAGIPQAAVSAIETSRRDPTVRTLQRLALALEVSPGTLLDAAPPWTPLDRHEVDVVARAIVSGSRALPTELRRLADVLAAEARPTLEASFAPGAARARRRGTRGLLAAERRYGRETIDVVLARLDKHMSSSAR